MVSCVFAQGVSLTLSPLSFDFELLPGSREEFVCTLFNESPQEVRFQVFVTGAIEERDGSYRPASSGDSLNLQNSCASWVNLEEDTVTIPPHSGRQIQATLTIPPNTKPGFYSAMITFESVGEGQGNIPKGQAAVFETKIKTLLGSMLFVRVRRRGLSQRWSGKFGVIEAFGVEKTEEGLKFTATLANRGKDVIEGKGRLTVTNALGKRIIDSPLGGGRGRVLPGFSLDFVTLYTKGLPPGDY
ncbi:MAG: DUF916 domain-containing protein, partial [Candidatus Atribacteria bacterium]|nr:DUF916 domain-containing protein [Candidatus Atribacteria bacterium]